MPDQLQLRGGTTAQHASFTGASKEVTVDTTKKTAVVHDGATAGGNPLLREDGSNSALALGSAGTPSLKFTGDPNTGIYSPGEDQVAISTNGANRLLINGTGIITAPGRFIFGQANNVGGQIEVTRLTHGVFDTCRTLDGGTNPYLQRGTEAGIVYLNADGSSAPAISVRTQGSERLRITSAGLVGIGTSSPGNNLHITNASASAGITLQSTAYTANYAIYAGATGVNKLGIYDNSASAYRMLIDSSGNVGINTLAPAHKLMVSTGVDTDAGEITIGLGSVTAGATRQATITKNTTSPFSLTFAASNGGTPAATIFKRDATNESARIDSSGTFRVKGAGTAGVTDAVQLNGSAPANSLLLDASGRLLVGTSTSLDLNAPIQVASSAFGVQSFRYSSSATGTGGAIDLARSNNGTVGTTAAIIAGQGLGVVRFRGAGDGSSFVTGAQIEATAESGTISASSMPTRLVFSTCADGASSPTERMRIKSSGIINFANTPTYADNTAALAGGLVAGDVYRKSDGTLMITY